ncbi:MAG: 2-phosphosulfolactate phosphatase [Candidatus Coatesbacteria bacterium]|nr:MAG: 2-phosphosulfolactate phosphatase [Candidatus Coatesbacteria bacterium]
MVAALAAGAAVVYPVADVELAFERRDEMRAAGVPVLLGGERGGFPVDGFDLGNSPMEYTAEVVAGKTLVLTTSNGAAAIEVMSSAPTLLAAGFVNLGATAEFILDRRGTVLLCCSGKEGRPAREDIICAGGIICSLRDYNPVLDDCSGIAADLFERDYEDIEGVLLDRADHGRYLEDIGFVSDLPAAASLDRYPIVVGRRDEGGFVII